MSSPRTTGRIIGILLLAHFATGLFTPYVILHPLNDPLTFAGNDPTPAALVRLAVMLLFVGGAVPIAIAVTARRIFRERIPALTLWLLAFAVANLALQCVENAAWMSMFNLSQAYGRATAGELGFYNLIAASVRWNWKWVHYTHLLVMVSWLFIFFVALWRSAWVPRAFAALGMLTALMQITGITLPQFVPYPTPPMIVMGLPLGIVYLALSVWLMVRGSDARDEFAIASAT
ncbi:MAG TPA: DUF4386 domain-containing protein [Pyrinomonadaceae bacterium]|nr:DUF4386 domain-containing protein [Pyrinomonadaceae bacterium]